MEILEYLLCAGLYCHCLIPDSHKLRKAEFITLFTHRHESLGSETWHTLPRSHSKYKVKLEFESPSTWLQESKSSTTHHPSSCQSAAPADFNGDKKYVLLISYPLPPTPTPTLLPRACPKVGTRKCLLSESMVSHTFHSWPFKALHLYILEPASTERKSDKRSLAPQGYN